MSYRAAGGGVIDSYSCSLLFAIRRPLFAVFYIRTCESCLTALSYKAFRQA